MRAGCGYWEPMLPMLPAPCVVEMKLGIGTFSSGMDAIGLAQRMS